MHRPFQLRSGCARNQNFGNGEIVRPPTRQSRSCAGLRLNTDYPSAWSEPSSPESERFGTPLVQEDEDLGPDLESDKMFSMRQETRTERLCSNGGRGFVFSRVHSAAVQTSFLDDHPLRPALNLDVNNGGREPFASSKSPVMPSAPFSPLTAKGVYVKKNGEFVKIGTVNTAVLGAETGALNPVPYTIAIQQSAAAVTTSNTPAEESPILEDSPERHESSSRRFSSCFSPQATSSPLVVPSRFSYGTNGDIPRSRTSAQKQAMRESLNDSLQGASFQTARGSFSCATPSAPAQTAFDETLNTTLEHWYPVNTASTIDNIPLDPVLPQNFRFSVRVLAVFSPQSVVVEMPYDRNWNEMERVRRQLRTYCRKSSSIVDYVPQCRELVCLWNSKENWCHRAVVVGERHETPPQDWCRVMLLDEPDIGKTVTVPVSDLRLFLPSLLTKLPCCLCELRGILPRPDASTDPDWTAATKCLRKLILEKDVGLISRSADSGRNQVDMFFYEKQELKSVADRLIEKQVVMAA